MQLLGLDHVSKVKSWFILCHIEGFSPDYTVLLDLQNQDVGRSSRPLMGCGPTDSGSFERRLYAHCSPRSTSGQYILI